MKNPAKCTLAGLGLLAIASVPEAYAQDKPATPPEAHTGMMNDDHMMNGSMPKMMARMNKMMDRCEEMMKRHSSKRHERQR